MAEAIAMGLPRDLEPKLVPLLPEPVLPTPAPISLLGTPPSRPAPPSPPPASPSAPERPGVSLVPNMELCPSANLHCGPCSFLRMDPGGRGELEASKLPRYTPSRFNGRSKSDIEPHAHLYSYADVADRDDWDDEPEGDFQEGHGAIPSEMNAPATSDAGLGSQQELPVEACTQPAEPEKTAAAAASCRLDHSDAAVQVQPATTASIQPSSSPTPAADWQPNNVLVQWPCPPPVQWPARYPDGFTSSGLHYPPNMVLPRPRVAADGLAGGYGVRAAASTPPVSAPRAAARPREPLRSRAESTLSLVRRPLPLPLPTPLPRPAARPAARPLPRPGDRRSGDLRLAGCSYAGGGAITQPSIPIASTAPAAAIDDGSARSLSRDARCPCGPSRSYMHSSYAGRIPTGKPRGYSFGRATRDTMRRVFAGRGGLTAARADGDATPGPGRYNAALSQFSGRPCTSSGHSVHLGSWHVDEHV